MKILFGVLRVVFGFIGVFWVMLGVGYAVDAGTDGAYGPMVMSVVNGLLGVAMAYWAFVRFPWEQHYLRDSEPLTVRVLFNTLRVAFGLFGAFWVVTGALGAVSAALDGAYGAIPYSLVGSLVGFAVAYWAFVRFPWERVVARDGAVVHDHGVTPKASQ
jgi:hypothetical protein